MISSLEELRDAIQVNRTHEFRHGNVELKASWSQDDGKKLSALANKLEASVGWLVVGVNDDGSLAGRDAKWAKQTEETISQHCNQYLEPTHACRGIQCLEFGSAFVLAVEVRSPGVVARWNGRAFKAVGTTKDEMRPEEVMELTMKLPGLQDFSARPRPSTVSAELVRQFALDVSRRTSDLFLTDLPSLAPGEVLARLKLASTEAARILYGDCRFRVVRFDAAGTPTRHDKYSGLYTLLTPEFRQHVQEFSATTADSRPYPDDALKEALANAVAHAAYFEQDGDIILELYPDRLCISNLCLQETAYFANRWFSRSHYTVNRLLMESLRLAGHVDELGRGKNLIYAGSICKGKRPPNVSIETAGRTPRWRLFLYDGMTDPLQIRVLQRLREHYRDEQKALLAHALVLWRGQGVQSIKQYIDGESAPILAEVLADSAGPVLYMPDGTLALRRWVSVLLGEGKDSKTLSSAEEAALFEFAYRVQTTRNQGYVTPRDIRQLGQMGNTRSEQTLSCNILRKWRAEGKVDRTKRGTYRFVHKKKAIADDLQRRILAILESHSPQQRAQPE